MTNEEIFEELISEGPESASVSDVVDFLCERVIAPMFTDDTAVVRVSALELAHVCQCCKSTNRRNSRVVRDWWKKYGGQLRSSLEEDGFNVETISYRGFQLSIDRVIQELANRLNPEFTGKCEPVKPSGSWPGVGILVFHPDRAKNQGSESPNGRVIVAKMDDKILRHKKQGAKVFEEVTHKEHDGFIDAESADRMRGSLVEGPRQ